MALNRFMSETKDRNQKKPHLIRSFPLEKIMTCTCCYNKLTRCNLQYSTSFNKNKKYVFHKELFSCECVSTTNRILRRSWHQQSLGFIVVFTRGQPLLSFVLLWFVILSTRSYFRAGRPIYFGKLSNLEIYLSNN